MPSEPRRATDELLRLLARTRPDWREGDILQVLRHLEHQGWPWARILRLFPAVAAEDDSRPGDVIGAWRHPNYSSGRPPTEEYHAAKQALTRRE
ncbi:hypothetical protein FLW53_23360 [Microbispora sp. SCL1-1]|uniref:hypothetical protein n=1 Tax=unclassified Microbispora TaxID=2614687 RepID=UPI001156EFFB|nr:MULTISPECIES: hypothetical protein [unclassified Microbispora]NJP27083.1 hypothetical protein [Microbispora sp. CL1-1]TQS11429.1 hypothetical protein FLW53_23360 [Microbispora sp. SCL1-1]